MAKRFDQAYFEKWYRGRDPVIRPAELRRKVAMAVAVAEYFLERPLRSVLDVGCGEAPWHTQLRALRPRARYIGVDPSAYAVERFGKTRNVRRGSFANLERLGLRGTFDLVVCSDVLHYLGDDEVRAGIGELARLTQGIAFIEFMTREDVIEGDLAGMRRRPVAWYRRTFAEAGFENVAPYCWRIED